MSAQTLLEEPRERVVRSSLNNSTSKQLWSFPKKTRFRKIKAECPHSSYLGQLSTLNYNYPKFSDVPRVVFEDRERFPSPAEYKVPSQTPKRGLTFGESRSKCAFSTYIRESQLRNPAPTDYQKFVQEDKKQAKKGFTMRPRTAHHQNYFVEDKERQQIPGPSDYETAIQSAGKLKLSKYKSGNIGGTGLMVRAQRFSPSHESPGPTSYEPKKASLRQKFNCTMTKTVRGGWTARQQRESSPGPGDYNLPSDFGHYCKPPRIRRAMTIQ